MSNVVASFAKHTPEPLDELGSALLPGSESAMYCKAPRARCPPLSALVSPVSPTQSFGTVVPPARLGARVSFDEARNYNPF